MKNSCKFCGLQIEMGFMGRMRAVYKGGFGGYMPSRDIECEKSPDGWHRIIEDGLLFVYDLQEIT